VLGGIGQNKIDKQYEKHKNGEKTISIHETINLKRRFNRSNIRSYLKKYEHGKNNENKTPKNILGFSKLLKCPYNNILSLESATSKHIKKHNH
jgi:hypothetical protein